MFDYVRPERYPSDWKNVFECLRETLAHELSDCPNFVGVDFCDVGAGGVQVRGHHKDVSSHVYCHVTLPYDFSNVAQVVEEFIAAWRAADNPEYLHYYQYFLAEGKKWGWD